MTSSAADFPGLTPGVPLGAAHFHLGHAAGATPQIIYKQGNGFISFDQDGTAGAYSPIHFATLTTHPVLHNTDFLVIA